MKKLLLTMVTLALVLGLGSPGPAWALQQSEQPPAAPVDTEGMALIPAGEFWMGRTFTNNIETAINQDREARDDTPARKVYVDAFSLDKHEVTNEEYFRFAEATKAPKPWYWKGGKVIKGEERHPVHYVTWAEADAYCKSLGQRLPTEAEWERAARGGLDRKKYPWGDEGGRGKGQIGSGNGTAPVASFPPNPFGLYDMAGNVWEWTKDWYDRDYYVVAPDHNPEGVANGRYRVIRGGGWTDGATLTSFRSYADPESRFPVIGFRCAKSAATAP